MDKQSDLNPTLLNNEESQASSGMPIYILIILWFFPVVIDIHQASGIQNLDLYLSNPLALIQVVIESTSMPTLLAIINVGIVLIWKKYRNIKSCKKIVFWWMIVSIIVALLGPVDLCCTFFTQQYIGSHIIKNASDSMLA